MVAIVTKYIGASNTKPSRISVKTYGNRPRIISFSQAEDLAVSLYGDDDLSSIHKAAAANYIHKTYGDELSGIRIVGGGMPDGTGYAFLPMY